MHKKFRIHKSSFKVAIWFFILSFSWIYFSDQIILGLTQDSHKLTVFQTWKGWFYITMAALLIFYLVNKEIAKKQELIDILNNKNEWQNTLIANIPGTEVLLFDKTPGFLMVQGINYIQLFSDNPKKIQESSLSFKQSGVRISFKTLKEAVLHGESYDLEDSANDKYFEIRCRPLIDKKNMVFAGMIVIHDVTDKKKILAELQEEKDNYEALFNEYHSVNLELKASYQKLKEKHNDLEQSNQRYEDFLMHTSDAVYRLDIDHPIEITLDKKVQMEQIISNCYLAECNQIFGRIYGFIDHKKLLGMRFKDVKIEKNLKNFTELLRAAIDNDYRLDNFQTEEFDIDQKPAFFSNKVFGIIENYKLSHIWGIKTDITTQKEYEQKLVEAKRQAEESDKLKSAFLANMSHEIRTPLNGIVGFSELLGQENLSYEQKQKYSRIVRTSNQQLLRIIDDILDISRIETGQLKIEAAPFSLNTLMNECAAYLQQELSKKSKSLSSKMQAGLTDKKDIMLSDKQRIYQVISNFLNNAVKFTEKGYINFGYNLAASDKIEFFVTDTGIGIPADHHKSIFLQFKQVEPYTSRKYGGTGLGLSISRGIAGLLGGEIRLDSEPGKGSTFWLIIPFRKPEGLV